MLSTKDNPFNPFTDFDKWYSFDVDKNYHSCAYLARVANTSMDNSDADNLVEIHRAIKSIVTTNVTGNYIMVRRPSNTKDEISQFKIDEIE